MFVCVNIKELEVDSHRRCHCSVVEPEFIGE